jgi:uncharacterized protein (DUF2236 family)
MPSQQALHPRAVAGIVQNSDFRADPLGRLVRTANFVGAATYCPRDEVERLAARVRGVHRSPAGHLRGQHLPHRRARTAAVAAMRSYLRSVQPLLRRTEDTDQIYDFLHRPPVSGRLALGLPVYEPVVGHLAYSLLPSWAVEMYGHRAYPAAVGTAAMRTLAETLRAVQKTVRTVVREPRLGPLVPHPVLAVRRLGKWATPSARRLPAAA